MSKLLIPLFLMLSFSLFAQPGKTYGRGVFNCSLGAGFPNTTHTAINATSQFSGIDILEIDGTKTGRSTPFFMGAITYGIFEGIDIGFYGGYFKSESEIVTVANLISQLLGGTESYGNTTYSVFSLGGKLVYHRQLFPEFPKLDLYASTYLGWNFVDDDIRLTITEDGIIETPLGNVNINDAITTLVSLVNYPEISYEINIGGKYTIAKNFNVYLEAGYGRYLVNAGLTYSIPTKRKKD